MDIYITRDEDTELRLWRGKARKTDQGFWIRDGEKHLLSLGKDLNLYPMVSWNDAESKRVISLNIEE